MASAQKGIMGMAGLSYVIGRKDIIEASKNYPKRSYYCNLYMQYEYFEKLARCISHLLFRQSMQQSRH